jgi:hypothetical protein
MRKSCHLGVSLIALSLSILLNTGARAQDCTCNAATFPINPNLSIAGPPAWSVGGTIQDTGSAAGTCPRAGCVNPKGCSHSLLVDVWVKFPIAYATSNPPQPPLLNVIVRDGEGKKISLPIGPTGVRTTDGQPPQSVIMEFRSPLTMFSPCNLGTGTGGGSFSLEWTPPGGGPAMTSGSVTVTCGGCG